MPPQESDALLYKKPSYGNHLSLDEGSSFISSSEGDDYDDDDGGDGADHTPKTTNYTSSSPSVSRISGTRRLCSRFFSSANPRCCLDAVLLVLVVIVIAAVSFAMGEHTLAKELAEERTTTTTTTTPRGSNIRNSSSNNNEAQGTGPYALKEAHKGKSFFDYYEFNDGPDSIGSAGYNMYVGREKAEALNLIKVEADDSDSDSGGDANEEYVYMSSSKPASKRDEHGNLFRDSIRLEGKTRFDHGLIVLDVAKMPSGCGVWPAFWSTDETNWPNHGEIDILEPINNQNVAKTALHTSADCDMYAHVPRWNWTGHWDSATGIPDTYTGALNFNDKLESDNCWTQTPHQWANQGCVAISDKNDTIGLEMNNDGGGIYVLEWDPVNGYIKAWVFPKSEGIPKNLQQSLAASSMSSSSDDNSKIIRPDPSSWPTPYAYFAIGDKSGCSADHFQNHRLVINLAFCGAVAGNRFQKDCPALYEKYNVHNDSVATCNAYIDSDEAQEILNNEAYWKIKGVYLYQRE